MKINSLILAGDGLNCEKETNIICSEVGFNSKIIHINDLLSSNGKDLENTELLVIPGGFSFGDELGSGKILSLKLKHGMTDAIDKYISKNKSILGICNGFQTLVQLGLFDDTFQTKCMLAHNENGRFMNKWVEMYVTGKSIFTRTFIQNKINQITLPVRHGEGRLLFADEQKAKLSFKDGTSVLQYTENVNGAFLNTAAIATRSGLIMGMMPHPEAFWCHELHPEKNPKKYPLGTIFFESAYEYFKNGGEL